MPKSYTVIALLEAKIEKTAELKSALIEVAELTRKDGLSLEFRLHQESENPQNFIIYEQWPNAEVHTLHAEKPYIQALGARLDGLLEKPYQLLFASEF